MQLNEIKKYIFQNVFTGAIKTVLTLGISIVSIPLVIKNIGLENYGIISIVLVFSSLTGMIDLGLSKALISFQGDKKIKEKEISAIYLINLGLFFLFLMFGVITYLFNINLMGQNIEMNDYTLKLINFIAIIVLALGVFNNLLRASLEANFKLQLINWGFLIQSAIINLGWLALALSNADLIWFLWVPLISTLVTIIYHLILLPPIYSTLKKPDKSSFKNVFGITSQFFKVGVLNSIHLPIIKYIIILYIGDGRAIGIFELSTKLAVLANNLLSYVSNPFFSIASKHKKTSVDYLWNTIKRVTKFLMGITVAGYLIFLILNKYLILYFFNEYSTQIFSVLNMVVIGYLFIAASEGMQKYSLGIGRIKLVSKIKFLGIIANGITLFFLILFDNLNLTSLTFAYVISLVFIGIFWLLQSLRKNNNLYENNLTEPS